MKKLLFLYVLFFTLNSHAIESVKVNCSARESSSIAEIYFSGPFERSFTSTTCVKRDPTPQPCEMSPYAYDDHPACPCVEYEHKTFTYDVWTARGEVKLEDLTIPLDLEFKQFSDSSRFSGTQSGVIESIEYTANFWSTEGFNAPGASTTINLVYGDETVDYHDLKRMRLYCPW